MAKSRASKGFLVEPAQRHTHTPEERTSWLSAAKNTFVNPSAANKIYYGWILEELWPPGHGIPGPKLSEDQLRACFDRNRGKRGEPPYKDVFRRMRELQGDEGFTSISKEGVRYQLQSLEVTAKRPPRATTTREVWRQLKAATGNCCAVCGLLEPEISLSPDHRVPRSRYAGPPEGLNAESNMQPLCEQCNNAKSSMCRGCLQICSICPWAYPETYKPIQIVDENREQIRRNAEREGISPQEMTNQIIRDFFNKRRR